MAANKGITGGSGGTDLFTIGSNENKFSIVQIENGKAKKLYDIPEEDSIFPIGEYKDEYYFIYYTNDIPDYSDKKVSIVKYVEDKQELETILETKDDNIMTGVFVKDELYFNVYDEDEDGYDLYVYDMKTGERTLVKKNLYSDEIYEYEDKLWYKSNNLQLATLDKKEFFDLQNDTTDNLIESRYGLLFQIYVNEENDCECTVTRLSDQKTITVVKKFIGYNIIDDELKLYSNDGVKKIRLENAN